MDGNRLYETQGKFAKKQMHNWVEQVRGRRQRQVEDGAVFFHRREESSFIVRHLDVHHYVADMYPSLSLGDREFLRSVYDATVNRFQRAVRSVFENEEIVETCGNYYRIIAVQTSTYGFGKPIINVHVKGPIDLILRSIRPRTVAVEWKEGTEEQIQQALFELRMGMDIAYE